MALTAITGGDVLQSHKYPAKKSKENKSDSVAPGSAVRKRTDTVDFKRSEVTRANQSAQLSAQSPEAQQLLGKIDFSA